MAAAWMRLVPPAGAVAGTAPPYGQNADSTFFFFFVQHKHTARKSYFRKKTILLSQVKRLVRK